MHVIVVAIFYLVTIVFDRIGERCTIESIFYVNVCAHP